jgi:hypothetical protein
LLVVDVFESSRREKRSAFMMALVLATVIMVAAAPVVEAQVRRIRGTVNVKDTNGDVIESEAIGQSGLPAPTGGSQGALAVRTFGGGNSFLGAADCDPPEAPADPFGNVLSVAGGQLVTGVIITGEATINVTSEAIGGGQISLLTFRTDAANPNMVLALDNGLELTDNLIMTCTAGSGQFVAIGQDVSG